MNRIVIYSCFLVLAALAKPTPAQAAFNVTLASASPATVSPGNIITLTVSIDTSAAAQNIRDL